MGPPTNMRRLGEVEQLSRDQLEATLDPAIASQDNAEFVITYLIDRYEFDLDALKAKLTHRTQRTLAIFCLQI